MALAATSLAMLAGICEPRAQPADEEPPAPPRIEPVRRLRLMLLDLADLREPENTTGFDAPSGSYRHTFGSQRRTNEETDPLLVNPEFLEADVVMLRGVTELRSARRMFPARDWRLLLSRGALGGTRTAVDDPRAATKPTAAVALWLQPGVRFGGGDPSLPPGLGTAMRILSGLGTLWVLSPAKPCRSPEVEGRAALCKPLEDWLAAKLEAGDIAVVGGHLPAPRNMERPAAAAPPAPAKAGPAGAEPLPPRLQNGLIRLNSADAASRCGGDATSHPALHVRLARSEPIQLRVAGYLLPIQRPAPPAAPTSRPPPPPAPPACALLLDIEAVQ